MARPLDGLPRPPHIPGLEVVPYRNEMAEEFTALEAEALEGMATFAEMGQPTGYEEAEGFDAFWVARDASGLRGFGQAMVPEGWINWFGVAPGARRAGIGHQLMAAIARQVGESRGTHLAALAELEGPAPAFLSALGFRERGARRVLMIRRAEGG